EALHVRLVRIALELWRQLQLLFDAAQTGREERREAKVGVDVRARDPRLGAQVLAVTHDAKAARAVVVAPRKRGGRPAAGGVSLVRVDVGREEDPQFGRVRNVAGQVLLENVRLAIERVTPVLPQTRVDVARAADPPV